MMVKIRLVLILAIALTGHSAVLIAAEGDDVRLMVGRSTVVNTESPIARVSLTSADIADALVTMPTQLLIQGKLPGTISMFVWDRGGAMRRYNVTVERDVSELSKQIGELFPGEPIKVESNGKSVVVAGRVSSKYVAEKAVEVAAGYVEKKEDVVSLLQVFEGPAPQVMLRVRFAEVSRSALTELGASFFTGPDGYKNFLGRSSTQQFPAPTFDNDGENKLVFSDFLNLFVFDIKNQLGGVIKMLQTRGLFQSLAEPNLVAESGKEASFLAGGEFPIPVAQASSGGVAITVIFKEFGIRLNFTPTVTATGRVRLKVRPEVSTLDFNNAIVLEGFRIPALTTRRTETELELRNGQTFAIAGLINNTATQSLQKIPGIGDIPILGLLFRSKAAQKQQTELVVMITPEILPQTSNGVTGELPRLIEPYMPPPATNRSFPSPPPAFPRPMDDAAARPAPVAAPAAVPAVPLSPNAADAAAVMKDKFPRAPQVVSSSTPTSTPTPTPAPAPAPAHNGDAAHPAAAALAAVPAAAPAATPVRPLSGAEKKRLDKAREQERKQQQLHERATQEEQRKQAEEQKKQQELAREQAREQAKRDAVAAEKAAKEAARQAEIDKKRQKQVDEAAARLKEAEAAYQRELAKKTKS
jgi:pilus assembly protein CpaC